MELQIDPKMANNNDEDILISVKQEPLVFLIDESLGCDGEPEDLPKAIEGLREIGPPPFLKKTYEMVDDPNTDEIISWTDFETSFVVWDVYKFSVDLLPKHFKHNNFSSFVRQLNTYRFRKIHPDRWEFANEGFQKGKKHLLKHIQRRKHNSRYVQQPIASQQSWLNSTNPRVDQELEKLKIDQNTLQAEILKLRQQQDNTQRYLATVEEHLRLNERKQKHIVVFMIKCLKNPLFLEHCIEKMKKKRAGLKRRRLDEIPTVDFEDQAQEEVTMVRSETQTLFSSDDSVGPSPGPAQKGESSFEVDVCSENFVLWEKLMEDDMIYEEEGEGKEQSDIVLELEDLLANPPEWDVHWRGVAEPIV